MTPDLYSSRSRWQAWVCLAVALAIADQMIKIAVAGAMPIGTAISITSWFNWVHVLNTGASFSFLANGGDWVRSLLTAIGTIAVLAICYVLRRGVDSRIETIGLVGIAGGALGNVIDRVRQGAVTDYLDFHLDGWHWPVFNLADVCIVGGAGLVR